MALYSMLQQLCRCAPEDELLLNWGQGCALVQSSKSFGCVCAYILTPRIMNYLPDSFEHHCSHWSWRIVVTYAAATTVSDGCLSDFLTRYKMKGDSLNRSELHRESWPNAAVKVVTGTSRASYWAPEVQLLHWRPSRSDCQIYAELSSICWWYSTS